MLESKESIEFNIAVGFKYLKHTLNEDDYNNVIYEVDLDMLEDELADPLKPLAESSIEAVSRMIIFGGIWWCDTLQGVDYWYEMVIQLKLLEV